MSPTPEPRPVHAVSEPLSGTVAGRFEIRSLLGVGGMGEIYLADDTRLKRQVALKRLAPKLRHNQKYRQHLLKEAERASSLNFQYIAAIHDVVESNDELLLVMEYVEGKTLRRHLPATWDVPDFLELAIQCAEALVAAHEKGVVHRDIKPENIMITPAGQVKVLDYGLAKQLPVVDENAITKTSTSASHELSGTWGYMAPEVLLEKNVDGRADIFSLGVVFYEMLSGRSPFLAPSFVQTLDRTLHEDPKPLASVVGGIPPELERIVGKMLAKSPHERYATARDLAVDLRSLQRAIYSGEALPSAGRTRRPRPRRWRAVLIAVLSILLLGAAALLALRFARRPATPTFGASLLPSQKLVAVLPFRTIGGRPEDQVYGDGLSETLSAKLTQLTASHDLQVAPAGEVFAHRVNDVDSARRELGVNLVLEGSLHQVGNSIRVTYALVDASTQRQLRADTVTADASDPFELEDRVVASVLRTLDLGVNAQEQQALSSYGTKIGGAHDLYLQGRGYLQAYYDPSKVDSAVDMFRRALELDPRYALAYAGLGEAFWRKYESSKDAQWVENAREACDKATALEPNLSAAHTCLGTLDNGTGQYDQAVAEFQRAVAADPTSDDAFRGLAVAYEKLNKPVEAERTYKLAIELRPHYWAGYDWLAVFYIQRGRYTDAAQQFQRAAELAPNNGNVYYSLGGTYLYLGHYEDAIAALRHGIEIRPSSPAYSNLGMAYFRLRRFPEAVQALETAYELGPHDPSVAGNLANAYFWAPGYRDKAPAAFRNAIALAQDELKVNPKNTGAHILLADFYALVGDEKPAYDHLKRALALDPNDGETWVYAAIVDEQFGRRDPAIADIGRAVRFGYSTAELAHAVELDSLRSDPRFQQLIAAKK